MTNFFQDLIKKIKQKTGLGTKSKIMTFEVGEGLTPQQKQIAEQTVRKTEGIVKPKENFFADILRQFPRGIAELTLKAVGQKEFIPGGGYVGEQGQITHPSIAPAIEKFLLGTEPIKRPEGAFQTGMSILAALPILPGGKNIAKKEVKELAEEVIPKLTKAAAKEIGETTIGLKALDISKQAIIRIGETVNSVKPELDAIRGEPLTHLEVIEAAKTSDLLKRITTKAATLKREASILKLKQQIAGLAEGKELTPEFVNAIKTVSGEATNLGRQLESLKISAVPDLAQVKTDIVKKLLDAGIKMEDIIRESKGIDFTNMNEVTKFYRQFIKSTLPEIVNEYRYINLLSSPKTHIINAFTNLLETTVLNPATRLASGGIDFVKSAITKEARKTYITEVPVYFKGLLNSVGDAVRDSLKVMSGIQGVYRPDIARLSTGLKIFKPFQLIPRAMEAADVFFRTLIIGGEKEALAYRALKQGTIATPKLIAQIEKEASDKAMYYVFRQEIGKEGQGKILSMIDQLTKGVYTLRKVPGMSWFIPFVTTPVNIVKQGIEFSPLGITTIIGAANKTEQIAKALIGSTIFAGAGYIAMKGDSTWSAPTDAKEKEYFYASGRQPYSLKIGNKWYNYARLGPLAYPIAMASAIKYYAEQNPDKVTQSTIEKIALILSATAKFFADQSYVQGIGNFVNSIEGDEYAAGRAIASLPSQLIPLSSLQRWITTLVDPIYRKTETGISVESIIQTLEKGLPVISKRLPAYKTPFGEEEKRQMPITNALSPIGVSVSNQEFEGLYNLLMQKRTMNAEMRKIKEDLKKELGL